MNFFNWAHLDLFWGNTVTTLICWFYPQHGNQPNHHELSYGSAVLSGSSPETKLMFRRLNMIPDRRLAQGSAAGICMLEQFPCSRRSSPTAPVMWDGKHPPWTIAKGPITGRKVQLQNNYPWAMTTFHEHFIAITTHDFNFQDWESLLEPSLNP